MLKSPGHLSTLAALFAEYPDARVIHTHRDPRRFIASLVSLLAVLRFMRSERDERLTLGPIMEMTYQLFLEQVIAQRTDGTVPDDQIVDTHFLELMSDPGRDAAPRVRPARLRLARRARPARSPTTSRPSPRPSTARTRTTYADLGLDDDHVRATFAPYVAHYGITEE